MRSMRHESSPRPTIRRSLPAAVGVGATLALLLAGQAACVGNIAEPESTPGSTAPPGDPPSDPQAPTGPSNPDPTEGLQLWNATCAGCHGTFDGGAGISTGDANGDFRLDAAAAIAKHGNDLERYINDSMPKQAPTDCEGICAQRTGGYIRSRQPAVTTLECDPRDTFIYGVRELKLLTSREYQNALEDLLGVTSAYDGAVANNDATLGGFINNRGKGINSATLEAYLANAEAIAAWAVANGRPFTCLDPSACARRFADEFLFRAFRGPVPDEQRALYVALFTDYPEDGLRLALQAALTSPYFLYRIEAGVDLGTALAQGLYTNRGGDGEGATGDPVETIVAADFPRGTGRLDGSEWFLTENGGLDLFFSTPFTDPAVVQVEARGTNHGAIWPELTLHVGGVRVGVRRVDSPNLQTYRFDVTGHRGTPAVRIEFNNDSGEPPYGPGMDANLRIARVSLVTADATPPPPPSEPTESPLADVEPDAYVLTPYELASALSFMLTGSTPDSELLAAAGADRLTTRAQIQAQVERLIDSPRGAAHFGELVIQWFGLDRLKSAVRPNTPDFTPAVRDAMLQEVREHFLHVFYRDDVPFSELFGGDYTFLNRTLANFYGVPGSFGDEFVRTPVTGRGGPIASGAFMTANAHVERTAPILRAVHARQSALCHYIDPPNSPIAGEDIDAQRAAAQARVVEREQQEGALSSRDFYLLYTDGITACAGCHEKIINPMFGMEDFDNVGRLRPAAGPDMVMERIGGVDKRVSLHGTLYGVESTSDPATIRYAGAKDFSNQIAETEAVKKCLVRRGFRYVTGLTFFDRDLDTGNRETLTDDQRRAFSCTAARMTEAFERNQSPRDMFIALATESLMRLRR